MNRTRPARSTTWLNRFAWITVLATLFLICSGGMVTSKGVGLAVPDWPTTFGYNMFLFPVSKWIGGIFFEHTHRLIALAVGLLTIILTLWLWRSEDRKWVRTLGVIAVASKSPEEFKVYMDAETAKWTKVIQESGLRPD